MERVADRVAASDESRLDPFVSVSLRRACEELRRFIPGLDTPPDAESARYLARGAMASLDEGDAREALARALRGLANSPHHPTLFYAAASACFEFGAVEEAIRLLQHTLWIHPGHVAARRDFEALSAYQREQWASGENPGYSEEAPLDPELAFDFIADGPDAEAPSADADVPRYDEDDEERAA